MLTTFDLDEYVYRALKAGASGFLLKDATRDPTRRRSPHRRARRGAARAFGHAPADRGLLPQGPEPGSVPAAAAELSEREHEVLQLLARGLSNAEIAKTLVLGETTVKSHVARVLAKLGLRDRVQTVVFAYESGFVKPGENKDRFLDRRRRSPLGNPGGGTAWFSPEPAVTVSRVDEVEVRRSERARRWRLEVPWGEPARLTAPRSMSRGEVEWVLRDRQAWIEAQRRRQVPQLGLERLAVTESAALHRRQAARLGYRRGGGRAARRRLGADPHRCAANALGLVLPRRHAFLQLAARARAPRSARLRGRPRALPPAPPRPLAALLGARGDAPPALA